MRDAKYIHGTSPAEQARLAALNRLTNDAFLKYLRLDEHETGPAALLEVGSGLGILAKGVAMRLPQAEIFGVEYSEAQLEFARKNAPGNLKFVQGDAHELPFEDNRFDLVYCRYVLEHVADPIRALSEMRRVLQPGGRICTQENNILIHALDPDCPNFETVWKKFAELQARLNGDAQVGKRLYRYFREAGFEEVELSFQPELHHSGQTTFRPWLDNLIGNIKGGAPALIKHGLASEPEIAVALEELERLNQRDDATACFYWNRATASK